MSTESQRYRDRAKDCRNMADASYDPELREALLDMAKDFDDEADRLDADARSANQP